MTPRPLHRLRQAVLALGATVLAGQALAHQIWFDRERTGMTFRYGEFDVNMLEVSPGGLDRFGQLTAVHLVGQGGAPVQVPLQMKRFEDGFTVQGATKAGESFVAWDPMYHMFEEKKDGKALRTRWTPATRWVADFQARPPLLKLDMVPTGERRGTAQGFQVFYDQEPLAGQAVTLASPSGWTFTANTDAQGKVYFPLPWRGTYVAKVLYKDETPGERRSDKGVETFEVDSYNTSLSFQVKQGLAALPKHADTWPATGQPSRKPVKPAVVGAAAPIH